MTTHEIVARNVRLLMLHVKRSSVDWVRGHYNWLAHILDCVEYAGHELSTEEVATISEIRAVIARSDAPAQVA